MSAFRTLDVAKSHNFMWCCLSSKIFPGLRSLCTIYFSLKYLRVSKISAPIYLTSGKLRIPFRSRYVSSDPQMQYSISKYSFALLPKEVWNLIIPGWSRLANTVFSIKTSLIRPSAINARGNISFSPNQDWALLPGIIWLMSSSFSN